MHIILGTGMDALAALSMDGLILSDGQQLHVKLASTSEEWPKKVLNYVDKAMQQAKLEEMLQNEAIKIADFATINVDLAEGNFPIYIWRETHALIDHEELQIPTKMNWQ